MDWLGFEHTGQFLIQAAIEIRQLAMVEAHQVQDRGMQIANVPPIDGRFVAKLVGFAEADASFDAAARNPIREALGL